MNSLWKDAAAHRGAIVASLAAAVGLMILAAFGSADATWRLLTASVPANVQTQLRVQLVDGAGKPVAGAISRVSSRIDMGPDNLPAMTASLRPLPSKEPGVIAFETNLSAPGRWALSLSANVEGIAKPVTGRVVIAATGKRSESAPAPGKILYYRNSMAPTDTSPVPKKDAMGMDYVPVYSDEVSSTPGAVHLTTGKIQLAGVRTGLVEPMTLVDRVRATGTIAIDESRQAVLTTKFDGFVEKLFVATTGAQVRAGEPMARVWIQTPDINTQMGPDVITREIDYIVALQDKNQADIERASRNLRNYGIPQSALAEIRQTGRATRSITLYAPLSGTVLQKPVIEGMRFNTDDPLLKLADLSTVWVLAQVSERDLAGLKSGQDARIRFRDDPGSSLTGKISFIYPEIDPETRTAQVRIVVANPEGKLRIGQYVDVTVEAPISSHPVLAVPDSAVIDDGTKQVAFLALPGGRFEPRTLVLGARAGGYDEVVSGLGEGDRIVTSGNFLIDAESNLQTAMQSMSGASK